MPQLDATLFYFHPDIPQYVRDAIVQHMQSMTFSEQYIVTGLDIVPERDFGYSAMHGDFWGVDLTLEIPQRIGMLGEPGMYPTRVSITFRVPVPRQH